VNPPPDWLRKAGLALPNNGQVCQGVGAEAVEGRLEGRPSYLAKRGRAEARPLLIADTF